MNRKKIKKPMSIAKGKESSVGKCQFIKFIVRVFAHFKNTIN